MKTIRELHADAGNPDFNKWKLIEIFSIEEAALLCASIDPSQFGSLESALEKKQPRAEIALIFKESLLDAARLNHIKLITAEVTVDAYTHNTFTGEPEYELTRSIPTDQVRPSTMLCSSSNISLNELRHWATVHHLDMNEDEKTSPFRKRNWSTEFSYADSRAYNTPALTLLKELIQAHWQNYNENDPSTATSSAKCITWLEAQNKAHGFGLRKNTLVCIDKVARHPSRANPGVSKTLVKKSP